MKETFNTSNDDEQTRNQAAVGASRRTFLKTAAGGALVASLTAGMVGSANAADDSDDAEDAGVVDYEMITSRYSVGDPDGLPDVLFGDDELQVRGTIALPTTNCHTVELEYIEYDSEESHLELQVVDVLESDVTDETECADAITPIRYDLDVTFEDGLPETVTAIESDAEDTRQITVASDGTTLPSPPATLEVTASTDSSVTLEWDGVDEADSYALYVDGDLEDEVDDTVATVEDLESATTYEIGVSTIDDGIESVPETTTVETDEEGEDDPDVEIDGYTPQDLSGDGLYEDITGDGRLASNDVVVFFENLESPAVTENVDLFDFSGNGRVGFDDVIALFELL